MLASLEWLKQYVDINIPTEVLVDKITRVGLEVETVTKLGQGLSGVVTGKVMEISRHPNSDHLWVCQMDYGQGGDLVQILTGAQNVHQYDIVPVATVGAVLPPSGRSPEGLKLKKAKMRGLDSFGMLCSADELGFDSKVLLPEQRNGIYILPEDTPIGVDIKEVLGLNDTVIDIDLTSNRADCFCMVGLAREIAAITGCPLRMPDLTVKEAAGGDAHNLVKTLIEDKALCPRFSMRALKNIKIQPSPMWMQNRLRNCGIRPISNVVDITNYVMLELGQPMHAYDADTLAGGTIIARRAKDGEEFMTLDNQLRVLNSDMIAIGDAEKAIGLGGVMGGLYTEVTDKTVNVLLEAAAFYGPSIRRTSRALGLRSEASGRFERGTDIVHNHRALDRAANLLENMDCCETYAGIVEAYPEEIQPTVIRVTPATISGRIGIDVSKEEIVKILTSLEFGVEEDGETLVVTVPGWRQDCTVDADISEEVARMHGLDHIESHMPVLGITQGRQNVIEDVKDSIQDYMAAAGLDEVQTYSFINPSAFDKLQLAADDARRKVIEIINPIVDDFKVMRTTMAYSVLATAAYNAARQVPSIKIFETGKIYVPKALPLNDFPTEIPVLAAVMTGKRNELSWSSSRDNIDFYDMKGVVEGLMDKLMLNEYKLVPVDEPYMHPGKSCAIELNGKQIGYFGELHPTVQVNFGLNAETYLLELQIEPLVAAATRVPQFTHLPKYPSMSRDIAVVVPQAVTTAELEAEIRAHAGELLQDVKVFDIYTGKQVAAGCKSMAFNLIYQAPDRTLTDAEVDASMKKVVEEVSAKYQAQLRA